MTCCSLQCALVCPSAGAAHCRRLIANVACTTRAQEVQQEIRGIRQGIQYLQMLVKEASEQVASFREVGLCT